MKKPDEMTDEELIAFVEKHSPNATKKFIKIETSAICSYENIDLKKLKSLEEQLLEFAREHKIPTESVYFELETYDNSIECYIVSTEKVLCKRSELETAAKSIFQRLEIEKKQYEILKAKFDKGEFDS